MKKLKISDSEARLLCFLLALLFLAGSYFLVFNRCVTKASEIEASNEQKQTLINQLESMVNRQAEVEKETAEYNQQVEEIIAKYPSNLTTEKAIAIVQNIEDMTEMHVSNISFLMDNLLGDISTFGSTAVATGDTVTDGTATDPAAVSQTPSGDTPIGYYASLSMNYEASYDSFKEMITYIYGLQDRMTIPAITAAYDNETGMISGVMTVDLYYLTNTGKEYEPPVVEGIQSGVSDIFRSGGVGIRNSERETGNDDAGEAPAENEEAGNADGAE